MKGEEKQPRSGLCDGVHSASRAEVQLRRSGLQGCCRDKRRRRQIHSCQVSSQGLQTERTQRPDGVGQPGGVRLEWGVQVSNGRQRMPGLPTNIRPARDRAVSSKARKRPIRQRKAGGPAGEGWGHWFQKPPVSKHNDSGRGLLGWDMEPKYTRRHLPFLSRCPVLATNFSQFSLGIRH